MCLGRARTFPAPAEPDVTLWGDHESHYPGYIAEPTEPRILACHAAGFW